MNTDIKIQNDIEQAKRNLAEINDIIDTLNTDQPDISHKICLKHINENLADIIKFLTP